MKSSLSDIHVLKTDDGKYSYNFPCYIGSKSFVYLEESS